MKILETIFSVKNQDIHKMITICGIKIKLKSKKLEAKQRELEINDKIESLNKEITNLKCKSDQIKNEARCYKNQILEAMVRTTPKPYLTNFTVDITHHCNLNCRGCDHFSCIAEEKFYDLTQFEADIKRLSELTEGYVDRIGIMGGEPLLNLDVLRYLQITRENFPNTKIRLVTNGILLDRQDENFWLTLKELHIFVEYTKYPIKLDYDKLDELIKKYEVPIDVYGYNQKVIKTSYKIPLDLKGNQNVGTNFINCFHANFCISLENGKLYTCTVAPNIEHFNKYFKTEIPLTDKDGIDIYKAQNIDEILKFLAKPIPFCKYCNVNGRTFGHEWGVSKKEIEEWI